RRAIVEKAPYFLRIGGFRPSRPFRRWFCCPAQRTRSCSIAGTAHALAGGIEQRDVVHGL
ncbi:MAG: hypothetical protein ACXWLB_27700, partial [Reyranella sp.]